MKNVRFNSSKNICEKHQILSNQNLLFGQQLYIPALPVVHTVVKNRYISHQQLDYFLENLHYVHFIHQLIRHKFQIIKCKLILQLCVLTEARLMCYRFWYGLCIHVVHLPQYYHGSFMSAYLSMLIVIISLLFYFHMCYNAASCHITQCSRHNWFYQAIGDIATLLRFVGILKIVPIM